MNYFISSLEIIVYTLLYLYMTQESLLKYSLVVSLLENQKEKMELTNLGKSKSMIHSLVKYLAAFL